MCSLPASHPLRLEVPTTYLLGLVNTCRSKPLGGDSTKEAVSYTNFNLAIFINLNAIQCVVGQIKVGDRCWGIVDHSGDYLQMVFEDEPYDDDDI